MPDWDYICGSGEEYGFGDPDMDIHDPAAHCGPTFGGGASLQNSVQHFKPKGLVCRHCGTAGLRWKQHASGKYWLHTGLGWHTCPDKAQPDDTALLRQALETLEDVFGKNKVDVGIINALRERLGETK